MARVLLLEDHPRLAQLILRALAQAGIECDVMATLDAADAALQLQPYAAALVDRGLPDGDGLTLVQRWRARGQQLPCLIITARDALHDRVSGLEAGADDYLGKPFSMEELVARVRALLRRPAQQCALEPSYGDLRLLTAHAQLVCGEQQVNLPRAELQLMQALMNAQGQAVRRTALEAAAWGFQTVVTPGALDVALHRLRRKLDALGSRVFILNVRGLGYAIGTS